MKNNHMIWADEDILLTKAYREGALARRAGISVRANPYCCDPWKYREWSKGHDYEGSGEHICNGVDVLTAKCNGTVFVKNDVEEAVAAH